MPIPGGVEMTPVRRVQILIPPTEVKYVEPDVVRDDDDFQSVHVTLACMCSPSVWAGRKRDTRTSHYYFWWFLAESFCEVSDLRPHSDIRY